MMNPQILKFGCSSKSLKCKHAENIFSSNKELHSSHVKGYNLGKYNFLIEITIKGQNIKNNNYLRAFLLVMFVRVNQLH